MVTKVMPVALSPFTRDHISRRARVLSSLLSCIMEQRSMMAFSGYIIGLTQTESA